MEIESLDYNKSNFNTNLIKDKTSFSNLISSDQQIFKEEINVFKKEVFEAYEKAIYNTKTYRKALNDITSKISINDSVLDLGCGTGTLLSSVYTKFKQGIDLSKTAISMAKKKDSTSTYIQGNFLSTVFEQKFSVIVANNLLNVVDEPLDFLEKMFLLLEDKGKLIISVPKKGFSFSHLMKNIEQDLKKEQNYEILKYYYDKVVDFNKDLVTNMKSFEKEEMLNTLIDLIGFDQVSFESTYCDQNWLIIAKKENISKIKFFANKNEDYIEKIGKLRNHCLRKIFRNQTIHSSIDKEAHQFIAVKENNDTVLGMMGYTDYTLTKKLPIEEDFDISQHIIKKELVGGLYSWYVLPTYQKNRIGKAVIRNAILHAKNKGIKQLFVSINPEVKKSYERIGCMQIGKETKYKGLDVSFIPMMLNLDSLNTDSLY